MDDYDDQGYAPSYSEIRKWAFHSVAHMNKIITPVMETASECAEDKNGNLEASYTSALVAFSKGEISEEVLVAKVADLFSWIDDLQVFGGTPLDDFWHSTKVCSTIIHIGNNSVKIIDVVYDLLSEIIDVKAKLDIATACESGTVPNLDDLEKYSAEQLVTVKTATTAIDEIISLSIKAGFLYRDTWWLENHGDAASSYYEHAKGWTSIQEARKKGSQNTQNKSQKQKSAARDLVREAIRVKGMLFLTASEKHKAETIQKIARDTRPHDFEFQRGKLRPFPWFIEQIDEMRSQGEFAAIASEIFKKT
jgi:hypothetical protein